MSLLLLCLVVVLIIALASWAISLLPIASPYNTILQAIVIIIGIVVIIQRTALL